MEKPTLVFFKKMRNTGILIAAGATSLLASPIALPAILIKVAGYVVPAGGVMSTVSQTAVRMEKN